MAYPQTSFADSELESNSFLSRKRQIVSSETLLYQLNVLKTTGRYDAFSLKWNPIYNELDEFWPLYKHQFWDSDVAKWIEGACYFLRDSSLSGDDYKTIHNAVKELVEMIRSAQQPDGYLNIHFTLVAPGKRFTNLRDLHELYNAGHLIEAALAHHEAFKNEKLLEPLVKYVKLLSEVFGPGESQIHGYPGHPEIELALIRLFERTGDERALKLAEYFITERGNPTGVNGRHYYDVEAEARGESPHERPDSYPAKRSYWYHQAHVPIVDQKTIEGHSVRALYLLTGVADLVRVNGPAKESALLKALNTLWDNMVDKKMYLTGNVGTVKQYEGFAIDYFLPQGTDDGGCYGETCAAIAVVMMAERMLQLDLDRKYADVMELCLYNAVLTGMSLDGKSFTYVNQLASSDTDLSKRQEWFTCACCPPNVARLLGYIGGCLWTSHVDQKLGAVEIDVHLYNSATLTIPVGESAVKITQTTDWPWSGDVEFAVDAPDSLSVTVKLRIPAWAQDWTLSPALPDSSLTKGYLTLSPEYIKANPSFKLSVPFKARLVEPHPYVNYDIAAVARGPIVYCVEDVDNPWCKDHFKSFRFNPSSELTEGKVIDPTTKEPYVAITAHKAGYVLDIGKLSQKGEKPFLPFGAQVSAKAKEIDELHFVPYYYRANRGGAGQMRVGLTVARN